MKCNFCLSALQIDLQMLERHAPPVRQVARIDRQLHRLLQIHYAVGIHDQRTDTGRTKHAAYDGPGMAASTIRIAA
ncbi:hypothetical protein PFI31113_04994 [Pandoraea fibrosis]|uniref:Uncharacterized protein n=1 Tax=Pandoraea fibrosis TaxID=1891094 RepID=A0A5E4Z5K4_9BURK|nr:hypothetical protein PFI31113_04994 [Pandoraea fibrosis]